MRPIRTYETSSKAAIPHQKQIDHTCLFGLYLRISNHNPEPRPHPPAATQDNLLTVPSSPYIDTQDNLQPPRIGLLKADSKIKSMKTTCEVLTNLRWASITLNKKDSPTPRFTHRPATTGTPFKLHTFMFTPHPSQVPYPHYTRIRTILQQPVFSFTPSSITYLLQDQHTHTTTRRHWFRFKIQSEKACEKPSTLCFNHNQDCSWAFWKISSASGTPSLKTTRFLCFQMQLTIAAHSPSHTWFCLLDKWIKWKFSIWFLIPLF